MLQNRYDSKLYDQSFLITISYFQEIRKKSLPEIQSGDLGFALKSEALTTSMQNKVTFRNILKACIT